MDANPPKSSSLQSPPPPDALACAAAAGVSRREWLARSTALAAGAWAGLTAAATAASSVDARLVMVILRGGLDGLAAVPVPGDPTFSVARGALADYGAPMLPLSGPYALHPALGQVHALYQAGELAIVHATGLPYRERSHFEAQQLLESGGMRPHELGSGWLARAIGGSRGTAMALQSAVPLLLRGPAEVDTWAPSVLPDPSQDLLGRLEMMYAADPALRAALDRARALRAAGVPPPMGMASSPMLAMAAPAAASTPSPAQRPGLLTVLAGHAVEFLSRPGGTRVALLEMGGWDTHANQTAPQGALAGNLRALDGALGTLHAGLAAKGLWQRTVVVVVTEFGRQVAINGTQGTDHGTGGMAMLAGGAVRGGQVLADWPGLSPKDRFEGRDLRITTDLRSVFRTVLHRHLEVPMARIDADVLPGSGPLPLLPLLRG